MSLVLRDYQQQSIADLREAFKQGARRQLLVSPTGSGKGTALAFMTKGAMERGLSTVIFAHRSEILSQISKTLTLVGVQHSMLKAGMYTPTDAKVIVASVGTLTRRVVDMKAPDFLVGDEIHHLASDTWRKVFNTWSSSKFVGLTATPQRLDGKGLGEFFDRMSLGPSVQSLIDQGYLAKPRYFSPPQLVDTSELHKVAGDFNRKESADLMDKPSITGSAVSEYLKYCSGRTAIVFCVNLEHARHVAQQFSDAGIPAASIDGTMDDDERVRLLDDLECGRTPVLTSCDLIGEGVDAPSVGAVILLRPTASLAMYLQAVGRGMRPKPDGSGLVVLDHVGNVLRHGLCEDHREWSLEGRMGRRTGEKNPNAGVRRCKTCFAMYRGEVCPQCGAPHEAKPREIRKVDGELLELKAGDIPVRPPLRLEESQCHTYEDFKRLGEQRGYSKKWAAMRWAMRTKRFRSGIVKRSIATLV